jgi:hypothetical protein
MNATKPTIQNTVIVVDLLALAMIHSPFKINQQNNYNTKGE